MKRLLFAIIALFALFAASMVVQAKRTLVPRYTSFISISEQGDTTDATNNSTTLYRDDASGMFRVAIIHETMTLERIRYIKANELAAGLATFAAVLSGISTLAGDWQQRYKGRLMTYTNSNLANIYAENAEAAKKLEIQTWLENTCDVELMIADQERGMVWFLQPGEVLRFTLDNPDVIQLRVSTTDHKRRHFVQIGAGSILREAEVTYETEDFYVFPYVESDSEGCQKTTAYFVMEKRTANQKTISKEEFKALKKKY